MAASVDPLTLSPRQDSPSQSQREWGEEPEETLFLIGDGLTNWMTEKVDFSSYHPTSHSTPSSSLTPSPPHHDVQVPSDLEVMTSLLQEELAQLEDYFLSDSTPKKNEKSDKWERVTPEMGIQPYCQLPYASYSSSQSEASPLLVTLATGELDLLSFCSSPIGRCKTSRSAPYNLTRTCSNNRKRVSVGVRVSDALENNVWSSKETNSGTSEVAVNYCCVAEEKIEKGCGLENAVKDDCSIPLKEEENYCFAEDVGSQEKVVGEYCLGMSMDMAQKKEPQVIYATREVSSDYVSTDLETLHCDQGSEESNMDETGKEVDPSCFLPTSSATGSYHGFIGAMEETIRAGPLETGGHQTNLNGFLGERRSECMPIDDPRDFKMEPDNHVSAQGSKENACAVKVEVEVPAMEVAVHGERKQKKRDQNKTAAHRYRQRKRAELDSLEEELRTLERLNRDLRDKAESVEREIQYVKDLLIEVYKARSQRLKQDSSG